MQLIWKLLRNIHYEHWSLVQSHHTTLSLVTWLLWQRQISQGRRSIIMDNIVINVVTVHGHWHCCLHLRVCWPPRFIHSWSSTFFVCCCVQLITILLHPVQLLFARVCYMPDMWTNGWQYKHFLHMRGLADWPLTVRHDCMVNHDNHLLVVIFSSSTTDSCRKDCHCLIPVPMYNRQICTLGHIIFR